MGSSEVYLLDLGENWRPGPDVLWLVMSIFAAGRDATASPMCRG